MLLTTTKFFNAIPPAVIKDNAAYTSYVLDKQTFLPTGAKGVLFVASLGATDIAPAVFKVQQAAAASDTTTLTTPSDVKDVTTKPAATDDNGLFGIYVPISKWTQRYLQLAATAGNGTNGTYLSAIAIADMEGDGAITADALGLTSLEIA